MYNFVMQLPEFLEKNLSYIATLSAKDTLETLKTLVTGLSDEEANKRLEIFGKNTIRETAKTHIVLQFLANFKNPLVLILLVISAVSLVTGETLDAFVVSLMVLMSVVLNFFQEYKANKAAGKLKDKTASLATVIRNGAKKEIRTTEICIGDILEFNAGDIIPADCRILISKDLFANQSTLTGESFPAEKSAPGVANPDTEISALTNILFH